MSVRVAPPAEVGQHQSDAVVVSLLRRVRRRVRLAWALGWLQLLAPMVAAAALGLVLLGRLVPWPWTTEAALLLPAVVLVVIALAALVVPVPLRSAALAADRGLSTKDAF